MGPQTHLGAESHGTQHRFGSKGTEHLVQTMEIGEHYSTVPKRNMVRSEHGEECPWQLGAADESVECEEGYFLI